MYMYVHYTWTPLGQKEVSMLVRCPDFRGCTCMYANRVFRTAKVVLYIEMSSFQGVLITEVPLYYTLCNPQLKLEILQCLDMVIGCGTQAAGH